MSDPTVLPGVRRARGLFQAGPFTVTGRLLLVAVMITAGAGMLVFGWSHVDLESLRKKTEALSGPGFVAASTVLPLVGFPVSWLHLIAGVRFTVPVGLAMVALITLSNLLLAWLLVRVLPERYFHRLGSWRTRLAQAGHIEATILCTIIPGMPYTVQLYLLPLLGVPLRVIVGLGVPIHTARALVTLLLGDATAHPTAGRLIAIGAYYAVLFSLSLWVGRGLRRQLAIGDRQDRA